MLASERYLYEIKYIGDLMSIQYMINVDLHDEHAFVCNNNNNNNAYKNEHLIC